MDTPILPARPCPVEAQPANVRSAVRKAEKYGWACIVEIAIGPPPDGIRSVRMVATKGATRLMSRHEGDTGGANMSFTQAYRTSSIHRGIFPLGWNELVAALEHDGNVPRPSATPKAVAELSAARQAVAAHFPGTAAVAVIDPGPLCRSLVSVNPRVYCNRQCEPGAGLCAGPCSETPDWSE